MAGGGLQGSQGSTDPTSRPRHPHHPHHPRTPLHVKSADVQSGRHISRPSVHCPSLPWHHVQTSHLWSLCTLKSSPNAPPAHVNIISSSNTRPSSVRTPHVSTFYVDPHNVRSEHVWGPHAPAFPPRAPRIPSKLHAAIPLGFRHHSSACRNVRQPACPAGIRAHADLHARPGQQYDLSQRQCACGGHHTIANGG